MIEREASAGHLCVPLDLSAAQLSDLLICAAGGFRSLEGAPLPSAEVQRQLGQMVALMVSGLLPTPHSP